MSVILRHFAHLTANYRTPFQVGVGLLDAGIQFTQADHIIPQGDSLIGNNSETWIFIKPAWYLGTKNANVTIGLNNRQIRKRKNERR